mmetsp:Transcript_7522/g.22881  ORF Transcript_7522/g.22881 Transcript_7522/m.22881 type:complete len:195 (+) Transcript_7522:148-732(+)
MWRQLSAWCGVSEGSRRPPSPRSPKAPPRSLWHWASAARWCWTRLTRSFALVWRRHVTGCRKRRAGGLIVRGGLEDEQVLLVSSRKNPSLWIIPSGTVERGETACMAALREVSEEAGVACSLGDEIGVFHDDKSLALTSIFVMRVEKDKGEWENMDFGRQRKWWRLNDAVHKLKPRDRPPLREYLKRRATQTTR